MAVTACDGIPIIDKIGNRKGGLRLIDISWLWLTSSTYQRSIYLIRLQSILPPILWVVDNIIFYSWIFQLVTDDVIVVIVLKKMVVAVIFGNVQFLRIDIIVDFGIDHRFESCDK